MKTSSTLTRKVIDWVVKILSFGAALVGIVALGFILYELITRGAEALSWTFVTAKTAPMGMEGAGIGNAILGTVIITLFATLMGVPAGLFAGVFLAEFGRDYHRFAYVVRFVNNILMGAPSIVVGVFVYALLVGPNSFLSIGNFSGTAGAVALAIIMLPVVTRTTEDILNMVPDSLRESGLALGVPRWKVTMNVIFRRAKSGLLTGVILAVARVSGETAPLLFTALNSFYWPMEIDKEAGSLYAFLDQLFIFRNQPTANMTVTINTYASSPYDEWIQMAWGAAFLIITAILVLNIVARYAIKERVR